MLTGKKYAVALDVARDQLTNLQIARKHGIGARTLDKWKADPEFKAEVERHLKAWRDHVLKKGIADRDRRIYRRNDRWRRLQAVIEQRATHGRGLVRKIHEEAKAKGEPDPLHPYPGITTGLVVIKPTRYGDIAEVDTGLLAEMSRLEQDVAIELGQWKPKHEITGADGGPLEMTVYQLAAAFTLDELEAAQQRLETSSL